MNNPLYTNPPQPHEDKISLVEIVNTVLRNWRVVVVLPALLMLVTAVWSLTQDRRYVASASFMPQVAEGRGASGAAALAQQFGVSLGTERPGQSPEFYVDLLRSRTVLREAVESEYHVPTDEGRAWTGSLIQYWESDDEAGAGPPWRRASEILSDAISVSVSRETGVVGLTVSSDHSVLAEQIAERLLELLNEYNLEVRQGRAQEEGRFISGLLAQAQAELLDAERALQDFLGQNRDFGNSPELAFEYERLQRQVMMRQEVYTSLLRSQEQARIDAVRDTPVLTVIDHPAGSAEPESRRTIPRAVLAFILGLMLAVFIAFIKQFARRSRETDDPHYQELQSLSRKAWEDLRHPGRWMRKPDKRVAAEDG